MLDLLPRLFTYLLLIIAHRQPATVLSSHNRLLVNALPFPSVRSLRPLCQWLSAVFFGPHFEDQFPHYLPYLALLPCLSCCLPAGIELAIANDQGAQ